MTCAEKSDIDKVSIMCPCMLCRHYLIVSSQSACEGDVIKPVLTRGSQSSEVFRNLSEISGQAETGSQAFDEKLMLFYLFRCLIFLTRCSFLLVGLAFIKGNVCICKFPALIDQVIIYSLLTFAEFSAHIYISLTTPREGLEMF